ncbi:MAG: sulfatase family protein [Puniceicoccales bacterium]
MKPKPNILFITDDQHRYDWLEWTDKAPLSTPNLDRLRKEGIWHRHVYSNNPLCMPARCSLITGLYSHQSGQMDNTTDWPNGIPTLPQALQRQGYHTAMIGKLHAFEGVSTQLDLTTVTPQIHDFGFDDVHEVAGKTMAWYTDCEWTHQLRKEGLLEQYRAEIPQRTPVTRDGHPFPLPEELYIDRYIGDHCVDWLAQYDREEPFFLWAGLCSPHPAYDAPTSKLQHYSEDEMPLPVDNEDPGSWPVRRAHYAAMIEVVDDQVGRMLAELDRKGLTDNTLIVFMADHGEMLGDHDLDGKCWPHDPSVRVPCLARWPGQIPPGSVSDGLCSIIDLTATCLEAAGIQNPTDALPSTPGRGLTDHWRQGGQSELREYVFSENSGQFCPPWRMIRTRDQKWVHWLDDGRESLFDMKNDPDEIHDLAREPGWDPDRQQMKTRLAEVRPPS